MPWFLPIKRRIDRSRNNYSRASHATLALLLFVSLVSLLTGVAGSLTRGAYRSGAAQRYGGPDNQDEKRRDYVGDAVCRECHQRIDETYVHTAHRLTSRWPSKNSIDGKFVEGKNILQTSNKDLHFRMEARKTGFFQTAVYWQPPDQQSHSERIDIVTGSGKRGQSYLFWRGNALFELPVSYWTEVDRWVNSPGFADGMANFDRPVGPRCLECHATYIAAERSAATDNLYSKRSIVLGVSCERCHGAGRKHMESERRRGTTVTDSLIVNPAKLTRDKQMDVCAQCHGGLGQPIAPAFSFEPGQSLSEFIKLQVPPPDAQVDVHGNQVALTERSRCYQSSQMTCTTCHDEHAPEQPVASYSTKCLQCHEDKQCGKYRELGAKIRENCIDCHMPLQASSLIISYSRNGQVRAHMRNHWIKVYPETANR